MDIGGFDITHEGAVDEQDADFVALFFRNVWPDAIAVVPSLNREGPVNNFVGVTTSTASFWVFYKDVAARESWVINGYTKSNADKVVLVDFESDCICFVVNAELSDSGKLVHDLCASLSFSRPRIRKQ